MIPRKDRRGRFATVAAGLALAATAGCVGEAGPLDIPDQHGYAWPADSGSQFTDAFDFLRLQEGIEGPIVLHGVEAAFDGGVEQVGVALTPGYGVETGLPQVVPTWPVGAELLEDEQFIASIPSEHPLTAALLEGVEVFEPGMTIPSTAVGRDLQVTTLLIGYEVTGGDGRYVRDHITVDYEVHGERYRADLPARIVVCVPQTVECSDPPPS